MKLAEAMGLVRECGTRQGPPFRALLACGFTPQHAVTFLQAHLGRRLPARNVSVEVVPYGDLAAALEGLTEPEADAVAVLVEWTDLDARLGHRSSQPWRLADGDDILTTAERQLERIQAGVERLAAHRPVAVALGTLPLPPAFHTPLGWASPVATALRAKVAALAADFAGRKGVRLVDPQRLDQLSPPPGRFDLRSELRWGFPYSLAHASALGELLAQLLAPREPMKAIITDLDDTLWYGILGEEGVAGVSWDLDHGSHAYALYQRMLALLADMGVLIGVATKNDPQLVKQALARPDLIVPASALFPVEANWGAKSESVARILQAWNIGAESVVFIDDSPLEVAEVTNAFPGMRGLAFSGGNEEGLLALLDNLRDLFGKPSVSEEDQLRVSSLRTSARRDAEAPRASPEEFLARAEAEITLTFDRPDDRAFELVNKTNQFNLNGRRLDESAWRARRDDPRYFTVTASYRDKFGLLGKIAVLSGTRDGRRPRVDVWVMSCRAFSRRIEFEVLKSVFERLGADRVWLDLAPTERNGPLRGFVRTIQGGEPDGPVEIDRGQFLAHCPPLYAKVTVE